MISHTVPANNHFPRSMALVVINCLIVNFKMAIG